MFRTLIPALLSCLLVYGLSYQPLYAQSLKEFQALEKSRASILKLGVGPTARVEVKLRDQTKVKGYISEAGQNSFTVVDKMGTQHTLSYADVMEVKKPGGTSTRTWLILGGVAAAAVVVGIIVKPALCDGGAQTRFPC